MSFKIRELLAGPHKGIGSAGPQVVRPPPPLVLRSLSPVTGM